MTPDVVVLGSFAFDHAGSRRQPLTTDNLRTRRLDTDDVGDHIFPCVMIQSLSGSSQLVTPEIVQDGIILHIRELSWLSYGIYTARLSARESLDISHRKADFAEALITQLSHATSYV